MNKTIMAIIAFGNKIDLGTENGMRVSVMFLLFDLHIH
jgi:hypothetical protein